MTSVISLPSEAATGRRVHFPALIAGAAILSVLLTLTVSGQSLWTDEAFSAYMAAQNTFGGVLSTLVHGDPADLLTPLYYIYLHWWATIFGVGESSLRAANVPFIILFAFALSWTSQRVFRSRWIWILAASLPFLWSYASDARAYFVVVALSTVCVGCLLAYFEEPSAKERRWLPWLVLGSLFLGLLFNVLMILLVAPLFIIVAFYGWLHPGSIALTDWKPALATFLLPFVILAAFVVWAASGGGPSEYSQPGLLSMVSVLYRFVGLLGYGPNRRYDTGFGPYLFSMVGAAFLLLLGFAGAAYAGWRTEHRTRLVCLLSAFAAGIVQVLILSLVLKQQEDVRHLAALAPLLLMALLAALSEPGSPRAAGIAQLSSALIGIVWLSASIRLQFVAEYRTQGEDFRSAVRDAVALYQQSNADIALVADPAAGAYYGLDLTSEEPCFPLVEDCATAFRKVNWPKKAPAVDAVGWTPQKIDSWLNNRAIHHVPAVVIISGARHPMYKDSAWWPMLRSRKETNLYRPRGFFVFVFK